MLEFNPVAYVHVFCDDCGYETEISMIELVTGYDTTWGLDYPSDECLNCEAPDLIQENLMTCKECGIDLLQNETKDQLCQFCEDLMWDYYENLSDSD